MKFRNLAQSAAMAAMTIGIALGLSALPGQARQSAPASAMPEVPVPSSAPNASANGNTNANANANAASAWASYQQQCGIDVCRTERRRPRNTRA